jgi:hypothetical protein
MNRITEVTIQDDVVNVWHPSKGDEGFCIAMKSGGWLPGVYDSVESATKGAERCFDDESKFVAEIQKPINHFDKENRMITLSDFN